MKELIQKVKEIVQSKNDESVIEACIELIEKLTVISYPEKKEEIEIAFKDFFNYETLNYVSDEKLSKINLEKWSKESILDWLQKHELKSNLEGIYNENGLVLAMNYEYSSHKNFIESSGNAPMTAYNLAKEALEKDGYIDNILDSYYA